MGKDKRFSKGRPNEKTPLLNSAESSEEKSPKPDSNDKKAANKEPDNKQESVSILTRSLERLLGERISILNEEKQKATDKGPGYFEKRILGKGKTKPLTKKIGGLLEIQEEVKQLTVSYSEIKVDEYNINEPQRFSKVVFEIKYLSSEYLDSDFRKVLFSIIDEFLEHEDSELTNEINEIKLLGMESKFEYYGL